MSAAIAENSAAAPKGKGKLVIALVAGLLVLGAAGGGGWYFLLGSKAKAAAEEEVHEAPKRASNYLAMENMVVNLADPGGERMAQVGITLDLNDPKLVDQVKTMMPAIRSNVLMLVSQRTSEELLRRDGKEKLAQDVRAEVSRALGHEPPRAARPARDGDDEGDDRPRRKSAPMPVAAVLFSAFIVQ